MLASGTISYTYDANGNLTAAGSDSYGWDYDNRLTSATISGTVSSYGYDAFGVRTTSVISGLNTSYLWDRLAENPLLLDDGSHAYVYADGPLAQIDPGNNRQYLLTDALNSVRGLSDGTGGLVGTVNYDVFGGVRSQSGATSALAFTGELYNPQTQLLHLRARDYAVTLGRLLSTDTVSPNAHEAQGYNVYAYVANNPTTWGDPSGHQTDWGGVVRETEQLYFQVVGEQGTSIVPYSSGAIKTYQDAAATGTRIDALVKIREITQLVPQMVGAMLSLAYLAVAFATKAAVGCAIITLCFALFAASYQLTWLVVACFQFEMSPCYRTSIEKEVLSLGSPGDATQATQDPLDGVPDPGKEKEDSKCNEAAFKSWWIRLQDAPNNTPNEPESLYELRVARANGAYGKNPKIVPSGGGTIHADGVEPSRCYFVEAKHTETPEKLWGHFGLTFPTKQPLQGHVDLIDELKRYRDAVDTSNGIEGAQPQGLILRTNSAISKPRFESALSEAGFQVGGNGEVEFMP